MKVQDVMKSLPSTCRPENTLAQAGRLMGDVGCGVLPVVDRADLLVGVLTDRDVCCSLTRSDHRPSEVRVVEAMSPEVHTCSADDPILGALETMKQFRVRRLPVVDGRRRVCGILSLDDVAVAANATPGGATDVTRSQVGAALQAIAEHRLPSLVS